MESEFSLFYMKVFIESHVNCYTNDVFLKTTCLLIELPKVFYVLFNFFF